MNPCTDILAVLAQLQSTCFLEHPLMVDSASMAKLRWDYSGNIKMPNANQFKEDSGAVV